MTKRIITKVVNPSTLSILTTLAVHLGNENTRDFVTHLAVNHPIDAVRFQAIQALAKTGSRDERLRLFRLCEQSSSDYLSSYGVQCLTPLLD